MKNNPFKMVGSYVGGVLGGALSIFSNTNYTYWLPDFLKFAYPSGSDCGIGCTNAVLHINILGLVIMVVCGFVLGWGIQSLIMKLRK